MSERVPDAVEFAAGGSGGRIECDRCGSPATQSFEGDDDMLDLCDGCYQDLGVWLNSDGLETESRGPSLGELERKNGNPLVWIVRISQEVGIDMIIPTTTRGSARTHAERVCSESLDDPVKSWTVDPGDGTSELGTMESGEVAIISRRYLKTEESDCEGMETDPGGQTTGKKYRVEAEVSDKDYADILKRMIEETAGCSLTAIDEQMGDGDE